MASVHDVASYILKKSGPMTAMKLQKLVYYCQAWSLVWDEKPLFSARIEAWSNGPVVPVLYARHRGKYKVRDWDGDPRTLTQDQRETIDAVLSFYGKQTSQWLSDLTHREEPWLKARAGMSIVTRGHQEITHASMMEYYSSFYEKLTGMSQAEINAGA